MAIPGSPAVGTKYKFGTLRVNGAVQKNPTKPWRPDSTPTGLASAGDIPQYSSGAILVGDSDANAANQIQWAYIGGNRYIADRNILCAASWNVLNTNGFVNGVTTTIDGVSVKISLLSGGVKDRSSGTTGYAGGTPTTNDWDRYILNEAGVSGLPVPAAGDKEGGTNDINDYNRPHNQYWNWYYEYSWCKEVYEPSSSNRVPRGYNAASHLGSSPASNAPAGYGFRPVLEVLNSAPLVSDPATDTNLGNKSQGFTQSYKVYDADGDQISVVVKLDGTQIDSKTGVASGTTLSVALTGATWNNLTLAAHSLTIQVTDSKSATTTRTLTFTKTNTPPTAPVITGLSAGQRLGASGNVAFTPSTDADGDTLSYKLQFASDSSFASDLQEFAGSSSPIAFSGIQVNTTRYVRIVANDGKTTTPSAAVQVKAGNVLEFMSNPVNRTTKPISCRALLDWTVAEGASYTIYLCNNANDASSTWENCTSSFNAGNAHVFTNNTKTNSSWAVGLRVVINAGTATGAIEVRAFGFDITVS